MSFQPYNDREVLEFGGAHLLKSPEVRPPSGLYARNVEFTMGSPETRRGFGRAISTHEAATTLYNWISGLGNHVVYWKPGAGIRMVSQTLAKAVSGAVDNGSGLIRLTVNGHGLTTSDAVAVDRVGGVPNATGSWIVTVIDPNTIVLQGSTFAGSYTSGGSVMKISTIHSSAASYSAVLANAGARLYAAMFGADGKGAEQGRVISYQNGGYVADKLFTAPMTYTPGAPTEPAAGSITAGVHRLGYIVESRTGYLGRPSPDLGSGQPSLQTFLPVVFTATGSKNAVWTLNTIWPEWAVRVHVIMTTVDNLNDWRFVPGASAALSPNGELQQVQITFDISDDDLLAKGVVAAKHLLLHTQAANGTGPFHPSAVVELGHRMGYVTTLPDSVGNATGALIVSEADRYQEVTLDQHIIQLPEQRDIVTAFSRQGVHYILGPHWTYATSDTGTIPAGWPAPQLIDGRRGTLSPRGVDFAPNGDAFVADQEGLFLFDGSYSEWPLSYEQTPDWQRINWNAAHTVIVKNNAAKKIVYVLAPLDGASSPTHILAFSYSRGLAPALIDYAIYDISGYSIGAIEVVQNDLLDMPAGVPKRQETWLASSGAAAILRGLSEVDPQPYRDLGTTAINSTYELAPLPGKGRQGGVLLHVGMHMKVRGNGTLALTVYSLDRTASRTPAVITLSAAPDKEEARRWRLHSEHAILRLNINSVDGWFSLRSVRWYYALWLTQR
jgi:hypothetical protein